MPAKQKDEDNGGLGDGFGNACDKKDNRITEN